MQVTILVTQDDDDRRARRRPSSARSRRSRCPSTRPHQPLRVHQPERAAHPDPGGAEGPERAHLHRSRARPTRATRSRIAAGGDPRRRRPGERLSLPGLRRVEQIMGMPIVVDVRDDDADADAARRASSTGSAAVDATLQHLQGRQRDQPHQPRRARARATRIPTCARSSTAARRCASRRAATSTCAPRPPRLIDPSGLVKGWAVDRAAAHPRRGGHAQLRRQRRRRHASCAAARCPRLLARRDPAPARSRQLAAVVEANDLAIATSGAYARGDHVVDPHTRRPPSGVLSVTITGPELATADAYATAAFAMGERGVRWTARLAGYEAMTILADGRVLSTPGFPSAR